MTTSLETPWMTEDWWTSPFNFTAEVRKELTLPERVTFHDVTLRDGEQTPGVVFRPAEKVYIAELLANAGVDRIEVALPAVSAEDVEAVKAVTKLGLKSEIFVLSRALESDIDLAVECGVDGVIFEVPVGVPRLRYQFPNWSHEDVIKKSIDNIRYARSKKLRVVFFMMDSSRAEIEFLDSLVERVSREAPPDSITLVDTAGCLIPEATKWLINRLQEISGLPTEIHTHTDLGMGVANSLAAVAAGAQTIHGSIAGIGERTGNTPLEEAVLAVKVLYGCEVGVDLTKLTSLCNEVAGIARFPLSPNKPIAGSRAFTRESGMGVDLVRSQPLALFCLNPPIVGQEAKYVLGKKSGAPSITLKLEDLGLEATDEERSEILNQIKTLGIEKKGLVTDDEFRAIYRTVVGEG
jgi:isopropylmalate/homocitrate/citramalate synthase